MQQLTFVKKNTLEWWDVREPSIQTPSEVLVRPFAAARCDLDRTILQGRFPMFFKIGKFFSLTDTAIPHMFGRHPYKPPFAFGHECVAEVLACGEGVKNFKRGDVVIVPFQISCGQCLTCHQGLTANCSSVEPFAMYGGIGGKGYNGHWGGALSDVVKVPYGDQMLVAVPPGIDPVTLASASDNLPDAWRTVGPPLKAKPGAPVLVIAGAAKSVGLYATAMAVALGAERVDYLDVNIDRLRLAKLVGANPIEGSYHYFKGSYPIVVDASNKSEGLRCALSSVAPGGICTSVGIFARKSSPIPLFKMYVNDVTFKMGVTNARANIPEVLSLVQSGRFNPGLLTTNLADWKDASTAFLESAVKVVVQRDRLFST
ncbi:MAG: alcohol dehydrogenase catalytic domain-containing protein [Bacteroidota bacterium]